MILIVSSIPMLLLKPFLWTILFVLLAIAFLFAKKESDPYTKALIVDGISLIGLGMCVCYLEFGIANIRTEQSFMRLSLFMTIFAFFAYEIVVFVRLKQKYYSLKKSGIASQRAKKVNAGIIAFASSLGAFTGTILHRLNPSKTSIGDVVVGIMIGLIWFLGFVLLQKYFILKINKNSFKTK